MATILFAPVAIALILVGALAYLRSASQAADDDLTEYVRDEQRWMPAEIAGAELVQSERQLYATLNGETIAVRPDQVYLTRPGALVPVDSKTREIPKTFDYDAIELSLQALAVAESHVHRGRGAPTTHGFIRIKPKSGRRRPSYHRVELWTRERLNRLHTRYLGIIEGTVQPTSQTNPKACAGCAYRSRCPKAR